MKLMTKEIEKKAQKAFAAYCTTELKDMEVVAKFFDPAGSWTWYLLNQDPADPDYLWGIVSGNEIEMGSFSLSELSKRPLRINGFTVGTIGIERDRWFKPMNAKELWDKLNNGEHV